MHHSEGAVQHLVDLSWYQIHAELLAKNLAELALGQGSVLVLVVREAPLLHNNPPYHRRDG